MDNERKRITDALNRSLSGLKADPLLTRRVIAKAKGETKVKRKLSGGLILALALALLLIGTACAAFSSQVAAFFGANENTQLGQWLEKGKAAQIGETVELGGVSVTLDEVLYRNRGLYAVGTLRALDEKDVLVPGSLFYGAEGFPEDGPAKELVDLARQRGGRLLNARCVPRQVGVDGGEMLPAGGFTYSEKRNEDGSLTFGFQVTNGLAITEGETYTLALSLQTVELTENGVERNGTETHGRMTVDFVPQAIKENAPAGREDASSVDFDASNSDLLVPEAYRMTGTLPVCRAVTPDFAGIVATDWFTDQAIVEAWDSGSEVTYVTEDYGVLFVSPESVYYSEYEGTYAEAQALMERDPEEAIYPPDALSREIAELAEAAFYHGAYQEALFGEMKTPSRDALYRITKQEAMERAEKILRRLGIRDYQCGFCLDMSVERFREMGAAMEQAIRDGRYLTDDDRVLRYDQAKKTDEGYFLYYAPLGQRMVNRERFKMLLYVTARGIAYANIRCEYLTGDIAEQPEALVTPDSVLPTLARENSQARTPRLIDRISGFSLVYTPIRAKDGGMLMTPTWHVTFRQRSSERGLETEGWAEFNAVSGELLDASFL